MQNYLPRAKALGNYIHLQYEYTDQMVVYIFSLQQETVHLPMALPLVWPSWYLSLCAPSLLWLDTAAVRPRGEDICYSKFVL